MKYKKLEPVHCFPCWNYECPRCGAICELADGDFSYNRDTCQEDVTTECDECGLDVIAFKGEI